MVELALLMPVLLVIFLGVVDFSRLYFGYIAATNAARVGAEAAMDARVTNEQVVAAVRDEAGTTVALTGVWLTPTVRTAGGPALVRVTYVFSPFTPLVSDILGGGSLPLVVTATAHVF